jgi:pyruvate formate lyase activating enzyme
VSFYYDPLPTNCVADWVCPGGTGAGHPTFANSRGPEYGYENLAVFYEACNFDCLFCQNWHFRKQENGRPLVAAEELAHAVRPQTSCICYFGGDPTPQISHALIVSRLCIRNAEDGILRICWETNGGASPRALDEAFSLSLTSGGCVKFDLKAWNENLHLALTGVHPERTRTNFARLARRFAERPSPPLLVASTLLVPGYVEAEEVSQIARFIASLDPEIPYALLGFAPNYLMHDLPPTSRAEAERALEAAKSAGLRRVRVGNMHLLW